MSAIAIAIAIAVALALVVAIAVVAWRRVRAADRARERALAEAAALAPRVAAATRAAALADAALRTAIDDRSRAIAQQVQLKLELAAARERVIAERGRAGAEVQRVLAPLLERERVAGTLAQLAVGELPQVLAAIADVGAFSSVLLADDRGLLLGSARAGAADEEVAGLWSMLLALTDRLARAGQPEPAAIVVHDRADRTILHRVFTAAGDRFLLTAIGRGRALAPETLDPALATLERVLARPGA